MTAPTGTSSLDLIEIALATLRKYSSQPSTCAGMEIRSSAGVGSPCGAEAAATVRGREGRAWFGVLESGTTFELDIRKNSCSDTGYTRLTQRGSTDFEPMAASHGVS